MYILEFSLEYTQLAQAMQRYIEKPVGEDLAEKMVFVGGPRQAGKTTMALRLLKAKNESHPAYLNWDLPQTKQSLIRGELPAREPFVVLDEIHKYRNWRNLVKGFYDHYKSQKKFLITGSARLDYYRRGGDSLQGRYHYYRLHPFSLAEVDRNPSPALLEQMLEYGGFPEPFLKANGRHYKRWQRERLSRVIYEDLASLESVRVLSNIELLSQVLPQRVGSILSVNNLKQDLSVAFETVEHWIQILERLYFCFRAPPYGLSQLRTAKKEKKLYLWDWSLCPDPTARFENLVASSLLKYCHFMEDTEGDAMELKFLRDASCREVDFVVVKNKKPCFAVECKTGERDLSPAIAYFSSRTSIPSFYQVHQGKKDVEIAPHRARILPFTAFCREIAGV